MKRNSRLLSVSIIVSVALFVSAYGVFTYYNETHDTGELDRRTFQVIVATLMIGSLVASLVATWFKVSAQDEVVRAAERMSLYWGWMIGVAVFFLTPWMTSLPEWLFDTFSESDADTLFRLSGAKAAYFGGGFVFMLIVLACWWLVKFGWWLAKR